MIEVVKHPDHYSLMYQEGVNEMKEPNVAFFEDLLDESYRDEDTCSSGSEYEIKDLDLQRLCNCNSGYPWEVCPDDTPYCG